MRVRVSLLCIFTPLTCLLGWFSAARADEVWQPFPTNTQSSLRGLAAISKDVAWACGSKSTVLQTRDGGKSWLQHAMPHGNDLEIRSIHAWDSEKAIVATAGQPALLLKTFDRGRTWKTTYENKSPEAFFDAMRFWDDRHGIAFSDPVQGSLLIVQTSDGGDSWNALDAGTLPKLDTGEAGFAASNSSLHTFGNQHAWIGLGGGSGGPSRIFQTQNGGGHWTVHSVPSIARGTSSGIFSIAFANERRGIAVGGDYNKPTETTQNVAVTEDGGTTWRAPTGNRPRGFRSCAVLLPQESSPVWIACGPNGCDWSSQGEDWHPLSEMGFHVLAVAPDRSLWAAGSEGRIAKSKALVLKAAP